MNQTLLVFDGNSLFNQAHCALPSMLTSTNVTTGGIYGSLRIMCKVIKLIHPTSICIAFDRPEITFRKRIDPNYKANRNERSYTFYDEFERFKTLLYALGVSVYEKSGYEADDLIGTIVAKADSLPISSIIYSMDLDLCQLITQFTSVYKLDADMRGMHTPTLLDEAAFVEKYGFSPKNLVDYKGLAGDASDNLKGVNGIGKVIGSRLVQRYGTLETIYQNFPDIEYPGTTAIRNRVIGALALGKNDAFHTRQMCTIVRDVPIDVNFADMTIESPSVESAQLFAAYEFTTLTADCLYSAYISQ